MGLLVVLNLQRIITSSRSYKERQIDFIHSYGMDEIIKYI